MGGLKLTQVMVQYCFFVAYLLTNTTGVNCTWSGGGSLEVDLHHCTKQVYYHVFLNAPNQGIRNKEVKLYQGDKFEVSPLGNTRLNVKTLSRTDNVINTKVSLCLYFHFC